MSQSWTDDVYASGHVGDTDLGNMENNFAALKSLFSGAAQPASMAACHPWFDTTKHVLKVRNDGDSAWYGLMHGDTSQKVWVYRNSAMTGWAVDSGVTDKVLGLKGGSTYTTGAATAGTWTQPSHTLTVSEIPAHDHTGSTIGNESSHTHKINIYNSTETGSGSPMAMTGGTGAGEITSEGGSAHNHSVTVASQGGGGSHNHGSTYRPAAAVGTLQYLDL